jgi:hypothetical protein
MPGKLLLGAGKIPLALPGAICCGAHVSFWPKPVMGASEQALLLCA